MLPFLGRDPGDGLSRLLLLEDPRQRQNVEAIKSWCCYFRLACSGFVWIRDENVSMQSEVLRINVRSSTLICSACSTRASEYHFPPSLLTIHTNICRGEAEPFNHCRSGWAWRRSENDTNSTSISLPAFAKWVGMDGASLNQFVSSTMCVHIRKCFFRRINFSPSHNPTQKAGCVDAEVENIGKYFSKLSPSKRRKRWCEMMMMMIAISDSDSLRKMLLRRSHVALKMKILRRMLMCFEWLHFGFFSSALSRGARSIRPHAQRGWKLITTREESNKMSQIHLSASEWFGFDSETSYLSI